MLILKCIKKIKLPRFITMLITSLCLMMAGNVCASSPDIANTAYLEVTPERCIALHKGQKCYLEVTFKWRHSLASDYCLVNTTTNKIIKCWQQQAEGQFSFDFQSKLSNDFALRKQKSAIDVASTQIPVAWVYKSAKRQKSTWRLF